MVALASVLAAGGAWQFGDAALIEAKAALAPVLLERAWRQSREAGRPVKAWPWADSWPVARLTVPRLSVSLPVLSGADGGALAFGPGHVIGTSRPGGPGNVALAGHRDTHFAFLEDLAVGDTLELESVRDDPRRYRVSGTAVVDSRETGLATDSDGWRLTLVTCYPFDAIVPGGPLRYVVFAEAPDAPSIVQDNVPQKSRPPQGK